MREVADEFITISEAAEILGVSKPRIKNGLDSVNG